VDPERFRGTCYRAANWVVLGKTTGRGKQCNSYVPNRSIKEVLGYPLTKQFSRAAHGARMKTARRRVDVNLDELDRVLDGARQAPLSEDDYEKLQGGNACAGGDAGAAAQHGEDQRRVGKAGRRGSWRRDGTGDRRSPTAGHDAMVLGRLSVSRKIAIPHAQLKHGIAARSARKATYTGRKSRKCWYGIVGSLRWRPRSTARTAALRCLRTGVYRARAGRSRSRKYDETAAADDRANSSWQRNAVLNRLENSRSAGDSVTGGDAWEVVEEAAELLKPARDELIGGWRK